MTAATAGAPSLLVPPGANDSLFHLKRTNIADGCPVAISILRAGYSALVSVRQSAKFWGDLDTFGVISGSDSHSWSVVLT